EELNMGGYGIDAIEAVAAQGKGPVVFGVQWWKGLQPSYHHALVAFRNMKNEVMIADQFGIRPISELGNIQGKISQLSVYHRALLLSDGVLIEAAKAGESVNSALFNSAANRSFLATAVGIQMVVVDQRTTESLDNQVRGALGRPVRSWNGGQDTNGNGN